MVPHCSGELNTGRGTQWGCGGSILEYIKNERPSTTWINLKINLPLKLDLLRGGWLDQVILRSLVLLHNSANYKQITKKTVMNWWFRSEPKSQGIAFGQSCDGCCFVIFAPSSSCSKHCPHSLLCARAFSTLVLPHTASSVEDIYSPYLVIFSIFDKMLACTSPTDMKTQLELSF